MKEKAFRTGAKIIGRIYPENSWRNEYARLRWWLICSDQYDDVVKPWFDRMLQGYTGKLWNRGSLIKFDYWLSWIFLGAEPDDYFDYEFFRKGWLWRNHHVTKQRLNFMDPIFNAPENVYLISNKLDFYRHWNAYLKRNWCIPQEVTFEEFQTLFGDKTGLLIKPIASFGGHGIQVLDVETSNLRSIYEQVHNSEEKILVEEFVHQKGFLHDVYPSALNIVRVATIRIGDAIEVLYAYFTVGCQGNRIANDCSGGIVFPIETATGRLGVGQGRESNGHRKHPDTGIEVTGQYIPDWEKIKTFACEAHGLAPDDIRLIGWDICWSDGELSIIEGNKTPGFPELPDKSENQWKMMKKYLDCVY